MKNKIKKISFLIFLIAFCYNMYAVNVSDNDGSAFITKSEFDALTGCVIPQIKLHQMFRQHIDMM